VKGLRTPSRGRAFLRRPNAGALGLGLALLAGCGSSAKGLIPAGKAGPLASDFAAVQSAAEAGNCPGTDAEIEKTERDFAALPASVDASLRVTLRHGIENLGVVARELCTQPISHTSTTSTTSTTPKPAKTAPKPTTTTSTETPPAQTTKEEAEKKESESPSTGGAPSEEAKHGNAGGAESEESASGRSPGEEGASRKEGSG
jgi:hypothetical protein